MRLSVDKGFLPQKCLVVFVDNTSLWWLKVLKKDFRHCFVLFALEDGSWLEINPMSNVVQVSIRSSLDLFFSQKSCFVEVEIKGYPQDPAPLGLFTCVEFVKRIIGVHSFFVITPYQLYNKLIKCRKKVLTF